MSSQVFADSFVSVAAALGLLILYTNLRPSGESGWVNGRFRLAILVLVVMLMGRVLFWLSDWDIFRTINLVAAALIPLAMLILCEGLMRRHGHRFLKIWTSIGAIVLAVLAPFEAVSESFEGVVALLAFQMISFAWIGLWVLRRDRKCLSINENMIIDRLAWSLLFILPFAATDFRIGMFDSPVRLSGAAILVLCWLSLSLNRSRDDHMQIVASLLALFAGSVVATFAVSFLIAANWTQMVQIAAILLCAACLLQIRIETNALQLEERRAELLDHVANFEGRNVVTFLQQLQKQPIVSDALVLADHELVDFNDDFKSYVHEKRIVTANFDEDDLPMELAEQLHWFFQRYSTTHVLHVSNEPFRLLTVNMPMITNAPNAELELAVVQKFAALMAREKSA